MSAKHPSQFLFSNEHPFTREFDVEFRGGQDQSLELAVLAPEKYALFAGAEDAHTSFSSLVLDTTMGCCVLGELQQMQPIATLSLNISHMRRPKVGEQIVCKAISRGRQGDVTSVTGEIHSENDLSLIAVAVGTFMIGTRSKPVQHDENRVAAE